MRPPPASSLLGLPEPPLLSFPPSRLRRSPPLAPLSTGATPGAGRPGRPLFPYGRATFPGLQLLLGPGTSGVDVTFILSVLDVKASRTRSTRGAPSARPSHPCTRPSHPASHLPAALHRPRLACTPRLHLNPLPLCARSFSMLPLDLGQGRGRRGEAARRRQPAAGGAPGRLWGRAIGQRWGAQRPPLRRQAHWLRAKKGRRRLDSFLKGPPQARVVAVCGHVI